MTGRGKSDTHNSPSPFVANKPPSIQAAADDENSAAEAVSGFFTKLGTRASLPTGESKDLYLDLVRGILKVESIERGKIKCFFTVIPAVLEREVGRRLALITFLAKRPLPPLQGCNAAYFAMIDNAYNGLHGGAVAMVVDHVAMACARTVVAEGKELFLTELSLSYLSAAMLNDELVVEGSLAKVGRNVTVVTVEIRSRQRWKLMYLSHATFLHGLSNSKL